MESDFILIRDLEVRARVGVTEGERRRAQRLLISIEIPFSLRRAALSDRLEDTLDYQSVSMLVDKIARSRPRKLIERLAGDIGRGVAEKCGVKTVKVLIKKFIVKRTRYVAVRVSTRA